MKLFQSMGFRAVTQGSPRSLTSADNPGLIDENSVGVREREVRLCNRFVAQWSHCTRCQESSHPGGDELVGSAGLSVCREGG